MTSLSGIAIDGTGCQAWVSGTGGTLWAIAPLCAPDGDGDGVPDAQDNCTRVANPDQRDVDGDGIGSVCDGDFDQSCNVDFTDLGLFKAGFFGNDPNLNMDGLGSVDFVDLGLFKAGFFQPPGPSGVSNLCDGA